MYVYIYIYKYTSLSLSIYISLSLYIYIHIYTHTSIDIALGGPTAWPCEFGIGGLPTAPQGAKYRRIRPVHLLRVSLLRFVDSRPQGIPYGHEICTP